MAVVWRWMLNKDYGMVNALLSVLGMPKVAWLTDAHMTIPILIVLSVWKGLGYKIIILLAALQGVDERYVKAGRMDGAGSFRRICHIILPILRPTILFLSVTSLIGAFKIFDEVYIMYGQKPGPLQSGLTNIRFQKFFRSAYFLPFVTSTTAVAVVWRWMLNKDYGMVNALLSVLGMPKVAWLTDAQMTIPILIVLSVWKGLGYKIIILLAALQGVDERYVKAGRMDGAGSFRRICYIILPILRPTILFLSVTSLIGAFKIFDEVYIMYGQKPGPLQSGLTIVYYIFDKFYRHWEFTTASAAAFLLFLVILFFTMYGQKPGPLQSGLTIVYYIFDKFYRHWEFTTASAAAFLLFLVILFFTLLQFLFSSERRKS